MKSILDNRPILARDVSQVAEVAGYLWQKGWAERNGGNMTLNITEWVDDEIRQLPALSEIFSFMILVDSGITIKKMANSAQAGTLCCTESHPDFSDH